MTPQQNETPSDLPSQWNAPTARKKTLEALFHAAVATGVGWFIGRQIHPLVELMFYGFGLLAALIAVYCGYRAMVAAIASKRAKH